MLSHAREQRAVSLVCVCRLCPVRQAETTNAVAPAPDDPQARVDPLDRFQLEIPESCVGRVGKGKNGSHKLPSHIKWEFKGVRKGWERWVC